MFESLSVPTIIHRLLRLVVLAGLSLVVAATGWSAAAPAFPPYTLAHTQLRPLPRSANGRDYLLMVALPDSYARETDRRYPVVYWCDGYWCLPREYAIRDALVYDKVVPEYIIVGLGYAGENLDYNRMRQHELLPVNNGTPESGHADEFLSILEKEIIPFTEREYRVDPAHRVLGGSSYGGVFTLYALFTKPELFWGYLALSPVVDVGMWPGAHPGRGADPWLFGYEDAFARSGRPLPARLFMSVGSYEWPEQVESIQRFHALLQRRNYAGLSYEFRTVEGERHSGTNPEASTHALQFIFAPLAPESGPMNAGVVIRHQDPKPDPKREAPDKVRN